MDAYKLIHLAQELYALSSAGIQYTQGVFDKERYNKVRSIAAQLIAMSTEDDFTIIKSVLEESTGYQTPKISTRAAIFNKHKEVLLVKDYDDKWVLPGGWCDFDQTVYSNTIKEVKEEAGLIVEPYRLVGIFDHKKRNNPDSFTYCEHVFMLCNVIEGTFKDNIETSECSYFSLNKLPLLNTHKTSEEQLRICLRAYEAKEWSPIID